MQYAPIFLARLVGRTFPHGSGNEDIPLPFISTNKQTDRDQQLIVNRLYTYSRTCI